jgi:catechol 2,3-dioxygenase-like lactoylglutathione lyase family enzyme
MMSFDSQITFCHVPDLEAQARFYEEQLGLDLVLDQGVCRIYRVTASAYIGFCTKISSATPTTRDGVILTLVADDVDGWYEQLRARGVVFEKPPQRNEKFDIYHCFVRDPAGYLVEIQRFDDPRWPGTADRA